MFALYTYLCLKNFVKALGLHNHNHGDDHDHDSHDHRVASREAHDNEHSDNEKDPIWKMTAVMGSNKNNFNLLVTEGGEGRAY